MDAEVVRGAEAGERGPSASRRAEPARGLIEHSTLSTSPIAPPSNSSWISTHRGVEAALEVDRRAGLRRRGRPRPRPLHPRRSSRAASRRGRACLRPRRRAPALRAPVRRRDVDDVDAGSARSSSRLSVASRAPCRRRTSARGRGRDSRRRRARRSRPGSRAPRALGDPRGRDDPPSNGHGGILPAACAQTFASPPSRRAIGRLCV